MEVDNDAIRILISEDAMSAYLTLLEPLPDEVYTVEMLENALLERGIVYGVMRDVLLRMIRDQLYEIRMLVAVGTPVQEGMDGRFEYHFRQNPNRRPQIREDGTVDYWSMNLIETVVRGQVIAIYKPAVQGTEGRTILGEVLPAKHCRELPPLRGRGFDRSNDNLTYVANMDGKIEMVNDRINISNFHEIFSNIDMLFGNIDFAGDVVIHGNVCTGMSVKARGTLTVDGVVEGAKLWAGKDIIIRGGVLGDNRADIYSGGDICAKFFEFARIESKGSIQADAFLQCEVECEKQILSEGKRGVIIGGDVHAIGGIEVNEIGNENEVKSRIEAGIGEKIYQEMSELRQNLRELNGNIRKLEAGIQRFDELGEERGVSYKNDPRRAALLRALLRDITMEKMNHSRMEELNAQEEIAKRAAIMVRRRIYPGTLLVMGYAKKLVKEEQIAVEYVKRGDKIILRGDELVE